MKDRYYTVINQTTGQVIATKVRIAQDYRSRSVGLLNRTGLEDEEGLLIRPCNSIHTFFMKFPIDVVFLDRDSRVLKIRESLVPWRLAGALLSGIMVLELPPGRISLKQLKQGDILKFE